ncbi:MAG: dihydrolipoamide acetyltransferase family protein [Candidatus Dormibacteria bacterium]
MPEFKLPDLGEGVTEGEVIEWRVAEGDRVARDEILVVVGTDKATVEIPSPFEGTVDKILSPAGARVEVGQSLIRVRTAADESYAPAVAPVPTGVAQPSAPAASAAGPEDRTGSAPIRVAAMPSVRRAARERGTSVDAIPGSGPAGRVRMADLLSSGRRVPLRGPQRVMAQRMAAAHRHVPQVTVVLECEVGALEGLLQDQPEGAERRYTVLGMIALATLAQLEDQPIFNCSFDEDAVELVYSDSIHLGIAVQTQEGLKVATLRDAGSRQPRALQDELDRLVQAAREGALASSELTGATFTLSSGGKLGGLLATTLVNWPNVATLGVHEITNRPVVRDGAVVVGRCANLSLSFDHRVIDGMTASSFLYGLRQRLTEPQDLLRGKGGGAT